MRKLQDRDLHKEVAERVLRNDGIKVPVKSIAYIIDKYFDHVHELLSNGYRVKEMFGFWMELRYVKYEDLKPRYRNYPIYSDLVYGFGIVPVIFSDLLKEKGYNFRPSKKVLRSIMKDVDSDKIFSLLKS